MSQNGQAHFKNLAAFAAKCDDNPCKWVEFTNSWTEKVKTKNLNFKRKICASRIYGFCTKNVEVKSLVEKMSSKIVKQE